VDILFSVQKPSGGFYPPSIVRKQLLDNVAELEATIDHHRISGAVQVNIKRKKINDLQPF
jgi:hypothetical protein